MLHGNLRTRLAVQPAAHSGAEPRRDLYRPRPPQGAEQVPLTRSSVHAAQRDIFHTGAVGYQQFNTIHVTQIRDLSRQSEDVHDEVSYDEDVFRPLKKEVGAFESLLRETQKLLDRSKGLDDHNETQLEDFKQNASQTLSKVQELFEKWRMMTVDAKTEWLENEGNQELEEVLNRLNEQTVILNNLQLSLQTVDNQLRRFLRTQSGAAVSNDERFEDLGDPNNWEWLRTLLRRFGMSEKFLVENEVQIREKIPEIMQEVSDYDADREQQAREEREEMEYFDEASADVAQLSLAPITSMTLKKQAISTYQSTRLRLAAIYHGNRLLREAASKGEESIVMELVKYVTSLEDKNENGYTALHYATIYGFSDMVQVLLDAGADPNAKTNNEATCLYFAATYNRTDIMAKLLEYSADPSIATIQGYLPIHEAAYVGSIAMIDKLFEYGSDIDVQAKDGRTPLMLACFNPNHRVAARLLEISENRNRVDSDHLDALSIAAQKGYVATLKILLEHPRAPDIDRKTISGATALDLATLYARPNAVRYLLGFRPNPNNEDSRKYYTLHKAAVSGNREIVELLIDAGAVVNKKSGEGWTPLHQAAWSGRLSVAEYLIQRHAVVTARDNNGWTPLHRAAYKGHLHLVHLLLEHGAPIGARDISAFTPLHNAASQGHAQILTALLDQNAELDARTIDDWTPLLEASYYGHPRCAALLIQYGANIRDEDAQGQTAMDKARIQGHDLIVDLLSKVSTGIYDQVVEYTEYDDEDFDAATQTGPVRTGDRPLLSSTQSQSRYLGFSIPVLSTIFVACLGTTILWIHRAKRLKDAD